METFPTYDTGARVLHFGGRRGHLQGQHPPHQPPRHRRCRPGPGPAGVLGQEGAPRQPVDRRGAEAWTGDLRDLAAAQHADRRGRQDAARLGRRGGVRARARRRVSAARALLRPFGGLVPDGDRYRRRGTAGPFRGGLAAPARQDGRGSGTSTRCISRRRYAASTVVGDRATVASDNGTWTFEPGVSSSRAPDAGGPHRLRPRHAGLRASNSPSAPRWARSSSATPIYDEPFWRGRGLERASHRRRRGGARRLRQLAPRRGHRGSCSGSSKATGRVGWAGPVPDGAARPSSTPSSGTSGPRRPSRSTSWSSTGSRSNGAAGATAPCSGPTSGPGTGPRCGRRSARSTGQAPRLAGVWSGYMDGAIRSGERAAAEVLAAL